METIYISTKLAYEMKNEINSYGYTTCGHSAGDQPLSPHYP